MPTIFERLDAALEGGDLSTRLTNQAQNLTSLATTVANLINNPPDSLADLQQALADLPMPDLEIGGDFISTLNGIQEALPGDLSTITGDLVSGLQQLQNTVTGDLVQVLDDVLQAVLAIYRLTQIDLLCEEASSTDTGANGTGGGEGGGGTGGGNGGGATTPAGATAIVNANTALDFLPAPLNVESFLTWLVQATDVPQRNALFPRHIPLLDDVRDLLETLLAWAAMSPEQVRDHMAATLGEVRSFIEGSLGTALAGATTGLTDFLTVLPVDQLTSFADDLTARLGELRTAVNSGDLSGSGPIVAAIHGLLDAYDVLLPSLQSGPLAALPDLSARLNAVGGDLEDHMEHIVSALQPNGALGLLEPLSGQLPLPDISASLTAVEDALNGIIAWLQELVDTLDLSAIQEPLATVAEGARSAVDALDQGLVAVTLQVQSLFGQVESLLDQLNTAAVTAQVEQAIEDFKTTLIRQLENLFAPVRDAVSAVVSNISAGMDAFDPEDIIAALQEVVTAITGVLQAPAVVAALGTIRSTLDTVTHQLASLSFAPLTDEVIAGIEEVTELLRSINTSLLSGPLQGALQTAMAALPDDLRPITDPLIADFGELVEGGPVPLVQSVRNQPQRLLDKVREFEPAQLVGDTLSQPYRTLLSEMEQFQPSQLLEPVQGQLSTLKERLRENANPAQVLEVLQPLYDQLTQAFNALDPQAVVAPLQETVSQVIDSVVAALPVDEVFDQVDVALSRVEQAISTGDMLLALLQRGDNILAGFENPQAQMDTWIDSIITRVDSLADLTPLQPALAGLADALDSTQASALASRFAAAADPLVTALDDLRPQSRLITLVQAYNDVSRQALNALPDSPEKLAIIAALDRFNPIQPDFGAPFSALDALRQGMGEAQTELQDLLADWDARYHEAEGILATLRVSDVTGVQLGQLLREAMGPQLTTPLVALLEATVPIRQTLGVFITQLQGLVTELQNRLTDLLLGPDSLGGIRDALQELVQRLQAFNLDFFRDNLAALFDSVRSKLDAIDPAHLKQIVEEAFDELLATLDISQVIPSGDVAQLDADYAALIDKLRTLDPETLVTNIIQPAYEEAVIPLLDNFDVTELLDTIIARLRTLDDELRQEMERVNQAYQAMLQAAPPTSLGIEVSSPF